MMEGGPGLQTSSESIGAKGMSRIIVPTIDSHHHFWYLTRLDYPWMPPTPSILLRNYLPEDLKPYLAHVRQQFGIDRLMFGSD